jgi:hypothetical protein
LVIIRLTPRHIQGLTAIRQALPVENRQKQLNVQRVVVRRFTKSLEEAIFDGANTQTAMPS